MNNMSNQTIVSVVIGNLTDMLNNTIKEADTQLVELLTKPVGYLEGLYSYYKDLILSAIQTKIESITSQEITVFRNTHPNIPENELNEIIAKHTIFYSILYQFVSSYDFNILQITEQEVEDKIKSVTLKELEKYNLNISEEEFQKIIGELIGETFISDLTKYLIITIPNMFLKLLLSLFPLINTPTVVLNILEEQVEGVTRLFTKVTLEGAELLEIVDKKMDKTISDIPDDNNTNNDNLQQGGKNKVISSKKIKRYSKKYYINRIRKTLKSFYKR